MVQFYARTQNITTYLTPFGIVVDQQGLGGVSHLQSILLLIVLCIGDSLFLVHESVLRIHREVNAINSVRKHIVPKETKTKVERDLNTHQLNGAQP